MAINLTVEQLQRLVEAVRSKNSVATSSVDIFLNCPVRFDGNSDLLELAEFIKKASVCKAIANINDETALKALPLLLQGAAISWWEDNKSNVKTWEEATDLIKGTFAPAYRVYLAVFRDRQGEHESTAYYVYKKRELLAILPPPGHPEIVQMDMVYGLLNPRIRDRIPRHSVQTFDALVQRARAIEAHLNESSGVAVYGGNVQEAPAPAPPESIAGGNAKKRCEFCRARGHKAEQCRKRAWMSQSPAIAHLQLPSFDLTPVVKGNCIGCGKANVPSARCGDCAHEKLGFC